MALNLQDYYMQSNWMKQTAGITQYTLERLGVKYEYARQTDQGYPVGGVLKALNAELTSTSKILGTKIGVDDKEMQVELVLKEESVLSKQISNQLKLSVLISKEEASERVRRVFRAIISITKNAIKNAAPRLVGVVEKHDAEVIMTEEWNDAIDLLRKEAKVISWEQDGSSKLLRTRLAELSNIEPEFVNIIKNRVDVEEQKSING